MASASVSNSGSMFVREPVLPPQVCGSIVILEAFLAAKEALDILDRCGKEYAVIRCMNPSGGYRFHVRPTRALENALKGCRETTSVESALDLRNAKAVDVIDIAFVPLSGSVWFQTTLVLDRSEPLGVIPPSAKAGGLPPPPKTGKWGPPVVICAPPPILPEFDEDTEYDGGIASVENVEQEGPASGLSLENDLNGAGEVSTGGVEGGRSLPGPAKGHVYYSLSSFDAFKRSARTEKKVSESAGKPSSAPSLQKRASKRDAESAAPSGDIDESKGGENGPQSSDVNLFMHAEMAPVIVVGDSTPLQVDLSLEKIEAALHEASSTTIITVSDPGPLTVRVVPKRNLRVKGEFSVTVPFPKKDKSAQLFFEVTGTDAGASEVWVVCCRGPVSLAILVLKPLVVAAATSLQGSGGAISAEGRVVDDPALSCEANQIDVYTILNGTSKRYRYVVHLFDVDMTFESEEFKTDIVSALEPLLKRLSNASAGSEKELELLMDDLRAQGAQLFRAFFPVEMRKVLWERRERIDHIKLYCEEPFVPWELLYITDPSGGASDDGRFMAQLGLVRWIHGQVAPSRVLVRRGKARYIAPRYSSRPLDEVSEECNILRELFDAQPVEPATRETVSSVLKERGSFDLLHFAGHADGSNRDAQLCIIELEQPQGVSSEYRDLTPAMVAYMPALGDDAGNRPLVVLNACRSDSGSHFLTGAAGFAQAFLERRAAAFIGTLWSIEDCAASGFVRTLYRELVDGASMSHAVTEARSKIMKMNDATFLAYAVYAHPFAKLEMEPAT